MLTPAYRLTAICVLLALGTCLSADDGGTEPPPAVTLNAADATVRTVTAGIQEQTEVQIAVTAWTDATVSVQFDNTPLDDAMRQLAEAAEASWMRAYVLEQKPPDEPYSAETMLSVLGDARTAWFEGLTDEQRQAVMATWGVGRNRGQGGPGQTGAQPPQGQQGPPQTGQAGPGPAAGVPQTVEGAGPQPAPQGPGGMGGPGGQGPGRGGFGFGERVQYPGGGVYRIPRPEGGGGPEGGEGGPGGPGGPGNAMQYDDPIRNLLLPVRKEQLSLDLSGVTIDAANSAFTTACGFLVMTDAEYEGTVTATLEDAELAEALDVIAAAAGAQWRMVYILSQPRKLTDGEVAERTQQMEQRMEQAFQNRWAEFWALEPAERAERIERIAGWMERMPQPEGRRADRFRRMGARMLNRMTTYSMTLSPAQREEIKPLLQAMAKRMK